MKTIYEIDREDLIKFMIEKLRFNRGIPITTKEVTEEYFGKPNRYDYKDLFFFGIALRIVGHTWKHVRKRTDLHVYRVKKKDKNGIIVIENEEDFAEVITRKKKQKKEIEDLISQLEIDRISDIYKKRVNDFFKVKVSAKEFNSIAKKRLDSIMGRKVKKLP